MKKNLKLLSIALVTAFSFSFSIKAMDVSTVENLKNCLKDGGMCKLVSDLEVTKDFTYKNEKGSSMSSLDVLKDTTLDLNGHTIKTKSDVVIKGGIINVNHGSTLIINDSSSDGKITTLGNANVYAAVQMTAFGDTDDSKVAKLIVNKGTLEGTYYAIAGNGSDGRGNTIIEVNGGLMKGLYTEDNLAIYHPQAGTLTINGGELFGETGIEMRAGNLVVNGGTITGNASKLKVIANGSGNTVYGAGIAVAQHSTGLNLSVIVNGGTIKGLIPLYEVNPQNNSNEILAKVSIEILGGNFDTINGGTKSIESVDKLAFLKSGKYSIKPDDKYLAEGYYTTLKSGKYLVVANTTITTEDENFEFESEEALPTNYKLVVEEQDKKEYDKITGKLESKYKDDKKVKDTKLLGLYDISVKNGTEIVPMEDGKFTISISIDKELQKYDSYKVIYIDEEGNLEETLDAKLVDGKVVFNTTHLSTYAVVGYNNVDVKNPNTLDNFIIFMIIGGIALITLIVSANKLRKNA